MRQSYPAVITLTKQERALTRFSESLAITTLIEVFSAFYPY
jgi:hypothetical protein